MPDSGRTPEVHINLNIRGMKPSATVAINEHSNRLIEQGRTVYKLGLGQSPFPVPDVVVNELRANAYQKDYLPVRGLRQLREAVADFHRIHEGSGSAADDVLIGPGSKELMFLLQLVYYGDLVIPAPAWVSYAPQARIIGRNVNFLSTSAQDRWMLTAKQLHDHCAEDPERPRIVILNYPSNPTGVTYTPEQLEEIAAVARQFKLVMLSDEIYGALHHEGRHVSIARYYPRGTIISSGLSKWCGAGGWRLGTFTFPRELRWLLDAMASVASETFTATSAPIQYAAVRAFRGGTEIERYLGRVRRVLKAVGNWAAVKLNDAAIRTQRPEGGFYLFPDFTPFAEPLAERGITTSRSLCSRLLEETGVAILPGSDFGRPAGELTARLAYVDFDGARALSALEALGDEAIPDPDFITTYCPNITRAVDAICQWVTK